ncbi:Protein ybcL precursor [Klebsiella pneumoniae IS43]|uniref:Protein ybcL n=1 Tax=Klebsiella pneumoniae IS43 TaxID=1432552 RepID=W1DL30_KLEPN|nr:Protein ybcL precursor [Klebsiella pneumoniae IS43]
MDAGASGALVGYLLHSHALASAQLTAMAGRKIKGWSDGEYPLSA